MDGPPQVSVFFATPMYGGKCDAEYFLSCMRLKEILHAHGIEHTWMVLDNESLITRARNICAQSFLESEYDYLMFIDADIGFTPDDFGIVWSLREQADVVASMYRMKKSEGEYAAWIDGELVKDTPDEPFEVQYAGTGFMLISRETFNRTAPFVGLAEYTRGCMCPAWFQDPVENEFHISEDYFFCDLVRKAGGRVLMTPNKTLKHVGRCVYG